MYKNKIFRTFLGYAQAIIKKAAKMVKKKI